MPYIKIKNCVYKKNKNGPKTKKGCSKNPKMAKKYLKKLQMVSEDSLESEIQNYFGILAEAPRDKEVLKKMNAQKIRNTTPKDPDEDWPSYNERIDGPSEEGPLFNKEVLGFLEKLPNEIFPPKSRKMFAIWLGRALTEGGPDLYDRATTTIYNDLNHIRDYINGIQSQMPREIWNYNFQQMMDASSEWHNQLASTIPRGDETENPGHLQYNSQNVIYKFSDGFSIVKVGTEKTREFTREEALQCHWAKDREQETEFINYYRSKGQNPPNFKITDKINDLDIEGCIMGHCVAGYCDSVSADRTTILSLRSPSGEPHATIEFGIPHLSTSKEKKITQIKGKQNDIPVEKYRGKIKEFVKNNMSLEEYVSCKDWLRILSSEEQVSLLNSQELKDLNKEDRILVQSNLAGSYELSDEVLEEILSQEDISLDVLSRMSENRAISGDVVKKIIKVDLEKGLTQSNDRIYDNLFSIIEPGSRWQDPEGRRYEEEIAQSEKTRSDPEFLKEIWEEIILPHVDKEFFRYAGPAISTITKKTTSSNTREEILSRIFEEDSVQEAYNMTIPGGGSGVSDHPDPSKRWAHFNWSNEFENIVRELAKSKISHRSLEKIHEFSKSEEGKALVPHINHALAQGANIPDSIIADILSSPSRVDAGRQSDQSAVLANLITNSGVSDSKKIDIMHVVDDRNEAQIRGSHGTRGSPGETAYMKMFTRRIMNILDANDNKDKFGNTVYGRQFIKWILESGLVDWWFFGRTSNPDLAMSLKEDLFRKYVDNPEEREEGLFQEIRDYFISPGKRDDKDDYPGKFDRHPQATLDKLQDPDEFAPWD